MPAILFSEHPEGARRERGNELYLAVAGYHLASLAVTPPDAVTSDYWMFEGLRASNNGALHVTSTAATTASPSRCAQAH